MSNLINKILDGVVVEWKPLGKVVELKKGKQLNKELLSKSGQYPAYNGGISYSGFTDCYNYNKNTIIISQGGASAGFVNFVTTKFYANAHCYVVLPKIEEVLNRYVYHFLKLKQNKLTNKQHGAGIPALKTIEILNLKVPIPCPDNPTKSLEIQSEIVRVLDAFTELTAELTTELTARKKQYNYYRDQLLTFEESEMEWKPLGKVAEYSKKRISFEKLNKNNYVGVENLLQNRAGKKESNRVPENGNLTQYNSENILIGNIRPYLKKIWYADCIGGTNGDVLVIHPINSTIRSQYLFQILADDKFFEYNMQYAKGAKMPRGNKVKILEYPIPIPYPNDTEKSLAEQSRIINILNKFDTLTHSISEGLPREIELRNKQYEYYRNLLLSFPKEKVEA